MAAVVARVYDAIKAKTADPNAILALTLEAVEAVPSLAGPAKKEVALAALTTLVGRLEDDPALSDRVRAAAALAATGIDMVVAATKPLPSGGSGVTAASAQVFSAYAQVRNTVTAARATAGGMLSIAAISALMPSLVRATVALKFFATASADDQTAMMVDLVQLLKADAPPAEAPAWDLAAAGLPPLVYALHAAASGTLSVNSVAAAVAANPRAAATTCMTCTVSIAALVLGARK